MKLFKTTQKITILVSLILVFSGCEKQDPLFEEIATGHELKAAHVALDQSTMDQINYLLSLIEEIEALVEDGQLNKGNANAIIVKIENSIKSLTNGNDNAAENQLSAFINAAKDYVENGLLTEEQGETFINQAETGIILTEGNFIDPRDGQEYAVVLIGDQLWMAENLKYLPEVSPPILESRTEPFHYIYGYNGNNTLDATGTYNYETYGVLYNYWAALEGCPAGWHLPSDQEWKDLESYLGMNQAELDNQGLRGTTEGGKLKEAGLSHWLNPNSGATNETGFTALPAGYRHNGGGFLGLGFNTHFWTSTSSTSSTAWYRFFDNNMSQIFRSGHFHEYGLSVRCIRE
jgi:uncharacterized protein (TIGR02145 family)